MEVFLLIVFGFLSGIAASMGLGGGTILILFLTLFLQIKQQTAQAINLLFFIPIGLVSIFFHIRNKLIETKKLPFLYLFGTAGAVVGFFIVRYISTELLSKLFAVFILAVGLKGLGKALTKRDRVG